MTIEHKNLPDSELHEVKGAAAATSGQVYVANGSGGATFQTLDKYMGHWDYDDATTAGTPIPLTLANTYYYLTNDGAGPSSNFSWALAGVGNIWNTSTQSFDFSNLEVGDTVDIRLDVTFNASASNDVFLVDLELGIGSATNFYLPYVRNIFKTSGAKRVIKQVGFYIGSADIRDNPAKFAAQSDTTGDTVVVNGWWVRVLKRSIG